MATTRQRTDLQALEAHDDFIGRHIGPSADDVAYMLGALGADSLDIVELVMAFEEAFDLDIPDEDAEKIATVKNAIEYIESKKK